MCLKPLKSRWNAKVAQNNFAISVCYYFKRGCNLQPPNGRMFIKKLYREWPVLCWALLLMMAAQGYFMYKGIENVPFFLYHMYGNAHPAKDSQTVYFIKTPKGYLNPRQFSSRQQELLYNTVAYYINLKNSARDTILQVVQQRFAGRVSPSMYNYLQQSLSNGPAAIEEFPNWWGRYFHTLQGKDSGPVQVVQCRVAVRPPYAKSPNDSLIFSIP
jgi:hypothetical protein